MITLRLLKLMLAALAMLPAAILAQGMDVEPNNSCQTAQNSGAPPLPFVIPGSLDSVDGQAYIDFYRIAASAGDFVRVDHQGASSGSGTLSDPLLGLFDTDCNLIALNDDTFSVDSRLLFTVPDNGAFILAATAFPDFSFQGGSDGSYLLTVSQTQTADAIGGRLVNALDGSPLPGDPPVFASVQLVRCLNGSCFEFIAFQSTGSNGEFLFLSDDSPR